MGDRLEGDLTYSLAHSFQQNLLHFGDPCGTAN